MAPTSVRASHSGLPVSWAMAVARSSRWHSSTSRKRSNSAWRSASGAAAQPGKASRAASTAVATWPGLAPRPSQSRSWETGSCRVRRSPSPACQALPISSSRLAFITLLLGVQDAQEVTGGHLQARRLRGRETYPPFLVGAAPHPGGAEVRHAGGGGKPARALGRLIPPGGHLDATAAGATHGAHVIDVGLHGGAAVEDVDIALPAQPLLLEHGQRRAGLLVDPADAGPGRLGEEGGVDGVLRHQLADEALLAEPGEAVRLVEVHGEEVGPQAVPEGAATPLVEDPAHLRQHLVGEAVAELRHEQPAHHGEQRPVALLAAVAAAVFRAQEERGHLGIAGMVRAQEE